MASETICEPISLNAGRYFPEHQRLQNSLEHYCYQGVDVRDRNAAVNLVKQIRPDATVAVWTATRSLNRF